MGGSIGSALSTFADLAVERTLASAGRSAGTTGGFGAQLEASLRARATAAGIELPATSTASTAVPGGLETADELWRRAQAMSLAAGNGPGDAMLRAMSDAADARWERRHAADAGLLPF